MKKLFVVAVSIFGLALGAIAAEIPLMYELTKLAKAQPDEWYFYIGSPSNNFVSGGIDRENPPPAVTNPANGEVEGPKVKVNQAYVWGLTKAGKDLWFGTGPNVDKLVAGSYLGSTQPYENWGDVAEFGLSAFAQAGIVPPVLGDWRPADVFVYTLPDGPLQQLDHDLPPTATNLFNQLLGVRWAGASAPNGTHTNGVVILGGPSITATDDGGIILMAYDAASYDFLDIRRFTEYSNIRKWLTHEGVLYTTIATPEGDGEVLRWVNDPNHPDYPLAFDTVGILDNGGVELEIFEGRLFVGTWPGIEALVGKLNGDGSGSGNPLEDIDPTILLDMFLQPAGIFRSPVIPGGGLTSAHASSWSKVWDITEYDPDPMCAAVTGIGALHTFDGYLYWGTMHVPTISTLAHTVWYGSPTTDEDLYSLYSRTQRRISLYRADSFRAKAFFGLIPYDDFDLLYGETNFWTRPLLGTNWVEQSTGLTPLYGPSGISEGQYVTYPGYGTFWDGAENSYTWTMAVYEDRLFVGTLDFAGGSRRGGDLWCFESADEAARKVSDRGVGNYYSYGIRTMATDEDGLILGMANPENLRTSLTDRRPEGGWELLRLRKVFDDEDWDDLPDNWEVDNFGSTTNSSDGTNSDTDDFSDTEEFIAGTDPDDGDDFFQIRGAGPDSFEWPGVSGRVYRVEERFSLTSGAWQTVGMVTGMNTTALFDLPVNTNAPLRFLRIHARLGERFWE